MKRLIKATLSGLSIMIVFHFGFTCIAQIIRKYEEDSIIPERFAQATRWVTSLALYHSWQWWISLPLIGVGYAWLAWLANESASALLSRLMMALMFAGICASALPYLAGHMRILHAEPATAWTNFIVPILSAIPLTWAIYRSCKSSH